MIELKPCPFCGGGAVMDWTGVPEFYGHEHQDASVTCTSCGAEVWADAECSCHHDINKIAAEKWNKRA